jgi:hypothetical protein
MPFLILLFLPVALIIFCGFTEAFLEKVFGPDDSNHDGPEDLGLL